MKLNFEQVVSLIRRERGYQDTLPPHRSEHKELSVGDSLTLMRSYMAKADQAFESPNTDATMDIMRKIVAIGFHSMETHGAPPRP